MASIYSEYQIPGNDPRLVESCVVVIRKYNQYVLIDGSTAVERARQISEALINMNWNKQGIKQLVLEAKQRLLPLHELDWFEDNERACYWVWHYLYTDKYIEESVIDLHYEYPVTYRGLELKCQPTNSKERFEEVVKFFDRSGLSLYSQRAFIANLKSKWSQIFTSRKPFSWLKSDNKEQIRWAWEYINKSNYRSSDECPSLFGFNATGPQEMYLAIYAAYDTWKAPQIIKRLFLNDFNKAWQQKKHRDSREGTKVCSFVLKKETKEKLDELAVKDGKKLNQLIEELIEREYAINGKK